ncbi:unnamed protein product, partial [Brassica oleracea]
FLQEKKKQIVGGDMMEQFVLYHLQTLFGSKIFDYMIIVFTGGDDLEDNDETLEDYLDACWNWDWIVWTLEIFIDAIEEEFKLEIPDIEADKIGSCSLAIKY